MARPVTRFLCRWRPRRTTKRVYNTAAAARIACIAVKHGASLDVIHARAKRLCPETKPPREDLANEAAIELAMENLLTNNIELSEAFRLFLIINGILVAVSLVTRFIPGPLRLVQPAAAAARVNVASLMTRINVQRAANDALYQRFQAILEAQRVLRAAA